MSSSIDPRTIDIFSNIIRIIIIIFCVALGIIMFRRGKKALGVTEIALGILAPTFTSYICIVSKNIGLKIYSWSSDWKFLVNVNENNTLLPIIVIVILYLLLLISTIWSIIISTHKQSKNNKP